MAASGRSLASSTPDRDVELAQFLANISEKAAPVRSFSCRFEQEKRLAMFDQPVLFSGRLVVSRPDKLRWEFLAPVPSALLFSGNKGLRCNDQAPPVAFNLQTDPVMHVVAEQLWLWLGAGYAQLEEQYSLTLADADTLTVVPRDKGVASYIGSVEIVFDNSTGQPHQVTISEPGGDLTILRFHSYTLNPELSDTAFVECGGDE